jgi:hypothetical protein
VPEIVHGVLTNAAKLQLLHVSQELLVLVIDGVVHDWIT